MRHYEGVTDRIERRIAPLGSGQLFGAYVYRLRLEDAAVILENSRDSAAWTVLGESVKDYTGITTNPSESGKPRSTTLTYADAARAQDVYDQVSQRLGVPPKL